MNIAIVDDSPGDLDALQTVLKEYAAVNRLELSVTTFDNAESLVKHYRPFQYTVIFLDIYMKNMTGIDAAREIRRKDGNTLLVFLTSSDAHMPDAFRLHAYDYIRKPVETAQIFRVMDDILKRHTESDSQRLYFYSSKRDYSLPYENIVTVMTNANYLEITDCDGVTYKTRMTFASVSDLLCRDKRFLKILRGVLVNMDYITGFDGNSCRLKGGAGLPISVKSGKNIEQTWRNYLFTKIRNESIKKGESQ